MNSADASASFLSLHVLDSWPAVIHVSNHLLHMPGNGSHMSAHGNLGKIKKRKVVF